MDRQYQRFNSRQELLVTQQNCTKIYSKGTFKKVAYTSTWALQYIRIYNFIHTTTVTYRTTYKQISAVNCKANIDARPGLSRRHVVSVKRRHVTYAMRLAGGLRLRETLVGNTAQLNGHVSQLDDLVQHWRKLVRAGSTS